MQTTKLNASLSTFLRISSSSREEVWTHRFPHRTIFLFSTTFFHYSFINFKEVDRRYHSEPVDTWTHNQFFHNPLVTGLSFGGPKKIGGKSPFCCTLLGWRPSVLGWRPSLVGYGEKPSAVVARVTPRTPMRWLSWRVLIRGVVSKHSSLHWLGWSKTSFTS